MSGADPAGGRQGGRGGRWQPVLVSVLVLFGLSLAAWVVFFILSGDVDTQRLDEDGVKALLEGRKPTR